MRSLSRRNCPLLKDVRNGFRCMVSLSYRLCFTMFESGHIEIRSNAKKVVLDGATGHAARISERLTPAMIAINGYHTASYQPFAETLRAMVTMLHIHTVAVNLMNRDSTDVLLRMFLKSNGNRKRIQGMKSCSSKSRYKK